MTLSHDDSTVTLVAFFLKSISIYIDLDLSDEIDPVLWKRTCRSFGL